MVSVSNLAALALRRGDLRLAETLAREALELAEDMGRLESIARACHYLAAALLHQEKKVEALPYARRAVDVFARLHLSDEAVARETLAACLAED